MPELDFDSKNKTTSVFDIDQVRLTKDEKARIAILDEKAKMEFAHYIMEGERGRSYVCLGDYATVLENQTDPDRCPACRQAEPGRDKAVSMPRRRFVVHVGRYRTNSKGVLVNPISMDLQAWVFGDDKYNKLIDRYEVHGDLRKHDLVLTCTTQQYQNYDIDVHPDLTAAKDENVKEQYKALQGRRNADIDRLLGRKIPYERMEALVSEALPTMTEAEIQVQTEAAIKDVMSDLDNTPPDAPLEATDPFAPDTTAEKSDGPKEMSFDDLLEN